MLKSQNAYTDNAWQTVGLGFADVSYTRTGWLGVGGNGTDICDFWLANDKGDVSLRPGINGKAKVADTEIATATPPQEFDLPLAEGFSSLGSEPSTYWKNQFGEVTVILQVKKNQPISDGEIAAYLPAGFSPSMQLRYPCLAPASRSMGFLYVYPNGGIAISFSGGAFPDVLASFTFLAAN